MGEHLREEVKKGSDIGAIVCDFLKAGNLVPDEVTVRVVEGLIGENPKGIILDGFPRNLSQARSLIQIMGRHPEVELVIIEINTPDDEIIRRLTARRQCSKCNRIYNLITDPPKDDEICDECKVKLIRRDDDKPEVIRNRLSLYHKETKPIIEYLKGHYPFYQVSGDIDATSKQIMEIIDGHRPQVS